MAAGFSSFSDWNPRDYIKGYYGQPVDSDPTLRFVVEQARRVRGENPLAVEVGSGPVICYFTALAGHVQQVDVADYLPANLEYLRNWLAGQEPGLEWNQYLEFVLRYTGQPPGGQPQIDALKALVRGKVNRLLVCDVTQPDPLGPDDRGKYDCVLSISCADSITGDKAQWREYMYHIFSLLKPGGFFIGESLKACTHYAVGEQVYPAVYLTEDDCRQVMLDYGFDSAGLVVKTEEEGYELDAWGKRIAPLRDEYREVILTAGFLRAKG